MTSANIGAATSPRVSHDFCFTFPNVCDTGTPSVGQLNSSVLADIITIVFVPFELQPSERVASDELFNLEQSKNASDSISLSP